MGPWATSALGQGREEGAVSVCSAQPTRPDRGWFVAPFGKNPWWVYLASTLPALLVTILIFMDQQITAVIVNRKENKLRVRRLLGAGAQPLSSPKVRRSKEGRWCVYQNVGPFIKRDVRSEDWSSGACVGRCDLQMLQMWVRPPGPG